MTAGFYSFSTPPYGIVASTGDNVFQTDPNNVAGVIQIFDNWPTNGTPDYYQVSSINNLMPVSSGTTVHHSTLALYSAGDPNLFDSDALPLVPPPIIPTSINVITIEAYESAGSSQRIFKVVASLDSLTLVPPTPEENLAGLAMAVMNLNLANGISNSLDSKIDAVLNALDDMNENNDAAACNSLSSFINAVEAQSGKQISESDAAALIADAMAIQDQLGCN